MALSPKNDSSAAGFSPTVARRPPTIPGVSSIPGSGPGMGPGMGPAMGASRDGTTGPRAESPKQLIVGRDIELIGQIAACESLVVEGRVEAELNDSQRIEITETGSFKGNVEIDEAVIGGIFVGELTVRNKLKVEAGGRITGVIRYAALEIEAGGQISGTVEILEGGPALAQEPAAEETQSAADGSAAVLDKSEIDDLLSDPS
jgi:cytoskeletal protein CcmA (bactofilin family)